MKKSLFILALLLMSLTSFSQVSFRPGVRVGANYSSISNTVSDSKMGLNAAVFGALKLTQFYTLQPEIGYSNQGADRNFTGGNDKNFDIHYVSIAVANKFFPIKDLGLHFIVGPSLDFNFDDNWINLINDDGESDITPIDFSLFAGIGYEFPFGLAIEFRYKQGFIDMDIWDDAYFASTYYEYDYYIEENDRNQLNSVFQLGLAYKFNF